MLLNNAVKHQQYSLIADYHLRFNRKPKSIIFLLKLTSKIKTTVDERGGIFLYSVNSDLQRFVLTLLNSNELFRSNLEDFVII